MDLSEYLVSVLALLFGCWLGFIITYTTLTARQPKSTRVESEPTPPPTSRFAPGDLVRHRITNQYAVVLDIIANGWVTVGFGFNERDGNDCSDHELELVSPRPIGLHPTTGTGEDQTHG